MLQYTDAPLVATVAFFDRLGLWEIVIIVLAVLLLFGGRKLPELARGLARGLRVFKDELKGIKTDIEETGPDAEQGQSPKGQPRPGQPEHPEQKAPEKPGDRPRG